MKHLHKFASVLLALVMAFSLMAPAFAAPNTTISQPTTTANVTIPTLENHTFKAYAIFTGTQAESEGDLADVKWGTDFPSTAFLTALAAADKTVLNGATAFTADMSAAQAAEAIAQYTDETAAANLIAQIAYNAIKDSSMAGTDLQVNQNNNLPTGYYLIVDTTTNLGQSDAVNPALLQLTNDITIKVKVEVPKVEKKVEENRDKTFGDAADYAIGDKVPYKFTSTVPDMEQYETYKYEFHDKMAEGLTFNNDVVVKIGGTVIPSTNYTVVVPGAEETNPCTFEIKFADLKTVTGVQKGQEVEITFTATLNENAVVGIQGNSNEVKLKYSNNPNESGSGDPANGETPEDKVLVFTYELDTNKVDGADNNKKLKDAEFHLSRTVTVKGENGQPDRENVVQWAVIDEQSKKITDWVEAVEGEDTYVAADAQNNLNGMAYAGSVLKSGEDGMFKVLGLDNGTYNLLETKAPAGYNTPKDPFVVTISSTLDKDSETPAYKDLSVSIKSPGATEAKPGTATNDTGIVSGTIANNSGATLPETGGIGTTIFYVVGGLLTVGAVVLLVTKKRMSADSDK